MKKKIFGKVAAVSLAGLMTIPTVCVAASALDSNSGVASGYVYKVVTTTTGANGVTTTSTAYYSSESIANANKGTGTVTPMNVTSVFGYGSTIYVSANGVVSTQNTTGSTKYTTTTGGSSDTSSVYIAYHYASNTGLTYLGSNGLYYPNLSSLYAAGVTLEQQVKTDYSYELAKSTSPDGNVYFNPANGQYSSVKETADCVLIYGVSSSYNDHYYSNYDTYDVYKVNGVYYPTLSAALTAAGNDYSKIEKVADYSAPKTNYFSKVTGKYYTTYEAALAASGNNASNVYTFSYYDGYYYGDPYYYYWLMKNNNKNDNDTSDKTTATIGKKKGWTSIAKYIKSLKSGSSTTVDMNKETVVPSTVIAAFKGRDITVKFVLDNGVSFTINGKDISSAKEINLDTEYNTKNVPSKLVKAAYKKNKAVSSAQISIENGSFGLETSVTVKFSTKRAGYKARLYRYNASKNSLSLVDTSKIQDNGKCTFGEVTKGGDFVIVIY